MPFNPSDIGASALKAMPYFLQAFVKKPSKISAGLEFERVLYSTRRLIEKELLMCQIFIFQVFFTHHSL